MIGLRIRIGGVVALTKLFEVKIPKVLRDLRPEMVRIGRLIQDRYYQVFRQQGQVGNAPKWVPLSTKWTTIERAKQGYGPAEPILVRSASYRRSFRPLDVAPFSVTVGSDDIRDTLLQLGGRTALSTVPGRPITERVRMAFRGEDWVEVTDILRNGLVQRWKDEGVPMKQKAA